MKKKAIDNVIKDFDREYYKNKHQLSNTDSVDKFADFSKGYLSNKLEGKFELDEFEKEIFNSYFESHVKSMYRKDFEKELIKLDENKNNLSSGYQRLIYTTWGGISGALGSLGGYFVTKSAVGAMIGTFVGVALGEYFAEIGIRSGKYPENIPGTKEYEKQLRKELYEVLSDN